MLVLQLKAGTSKEEQMLELHSRSLLRKTCWRTLIDQGFSRVMTPHPDNSQSTKE
jgi:hypothetical protein